ncbi:CGNR zinc finger domain-containing protein [Nocardia sp. NPDC003482]
MQPPRLGGRLCLDFANTVGPRRSRPDKASHEYLGTLPDLVRWCAAAELVDGPDALRGDDLLHRCLDLREAIHRTFAALAADRRPPDEDVAAILYAHSETLRHATLTVTGPRARLTWPRTGPSAVLGPIADSAVDLLRTGDLDRIRVCPGHDESCGWLFYDTTKNRSRRWCSMDLCGAHDKVRRHRARA